MLPVSEKTCRQDPGLGSRQTAGLGSCGAVPFVTASIAGTAGWENYSSHHPFVHVPAKLQFPEPFNEPDRMSMEINADDFCITPCTSGVLTGP